jgi:tetratricopeptide (TPR) repeat protein
VYALGVTLYELLDGRPPFRASDTYELLRRIVEEEPAPPGADAPLQAIVMKCLRKDPLGRYATAGAMAEDLRRWLEGEPVSARPLSIVARARRWAVRRKAILALAAATGLCALLAVGQTARLRRRAAADRERAASLATLRATVAERKRELRGARVMPETARRELAEAVRALDGHLVRWPDDAAAEYVRGRGRLELGDAAGAETDARAAVSKGFRPGWTLLGLVLMHRYHQRVDGPGWNHRARLAAASDLVDEAKRAFERGAGGAADAAREGLGWTRDDAVTEQLAAALHLEMHAGDRAGARRVLEASYAQYRDEEVARWLGLLTEDADELVRRMSEAIALAPGWEMPYYDRAFGRYLRGDVAGAEADMTEAIRLRPDWVEARLNRGAYRSKLGNFAGARADLKGVLERRPDLADAHFNLGVVAERAGDESSALAAYDRAVVVHEAHPQARYNRAALRWKAGDRDGAVADYSRVIELVPDCVAAFHNRGVCLSHMGRQAEASADFERAAALQRVR